MAAFHQSTHAGAFRILSTAELAPLARCLAIDGLRLVHLFLEDPEENIVGGVMYHFDQVVELLF